MNQRLRFRVLERDGFRCRYCGATGNERPLEVDHLIPRSAGGPDLMLNLVTACRPCNQGKKHHGLPKSELIRLVNENKPVWQEERPRPVIDFPRGPSGLEHVSSVVARIYDGLDNARSAA